MDNSSMKTKYPILLLHGVGFRDLKWPLYWGRIPNALSGAGAVLFYGNQDCWARVEDVYRQYYDNRNASPGVKND